MVVKRRIVGLALVVGVVQYDHDVEYSKPKEGRKVPSIMLCNEAVQEGTRHAVDTRSVWGSQ